MNDDLWDRVRGLGSETWQGCERVEQCFMSSVKHIMYFGKIGLKLNILGDVTFGVTFHSIYCTANYFD